MMKKDKMYRRLMSMDGFIIAQIKDDKINVLYNEFLLGELTVSLMNTPEEDMLELLSVACELKKSPLNTFHKYPFVPCEPPQSKLAPRRVPTVDDLKKAQKYLTITNKLLSSIEVGSLVTRFYPLPQTDLDQLGRIDRRSKQFKEILTDYVVCYNNYLLAANDIIAMYDYIRNYVYNSMNHSDSLDVSSLSKTYRYVMSKDDTGWEIDRLLEALEGEYRLGDQIILQYVPMKKENSDDWMISEFFRFDTLQGLLKTDFVRGLMKGHFPRKCEHCGRYAGMAQALNACGIEVWGYDQRGHGTNPLGPRGYARVADLEKDILSALLATFTFPHCHISEHVTFLDGFATHWDDEPKTIHLPDVPAYDLGKFHQIAHPA